MVPSVSVQVRSVARDTLATAVPWGVKRNSASRPSRPTRITLLTTGSLLSASDTADGEDPSVHIQRIGLKHERIIAVFATGDEARRVRPGSKLIENPSS